MSPSCAASPGSAARDSRLGGALEWLDHTFAGNFERNRALLHSLTALGSDGASPRPRALLRSFTLNDLKDPTDSSLYGRVDGFAVAFAMADAARAQPAILDLARRFGQPNVHRYRLQGQGLVQRTLWCDRLLESRQRGFPEHWVAMAPPPPEEQLGGVHWRGGDPQEEPIVWEAIDAFPELGDAGDAHIAESRNAGDAHIAESHASPLERLPSEASEQLPSEASEKLPFEEARGEGSVSPLEEWLRVLPLGALATLRSCAGALGLHLSSNLGWQLENMVRAWDKTLGSGGPTRRAPTRPAPTSTREPKASSGDSCEWLAREGSRLELPALPDLVPDLDAPSAFGHEALPASWPAILPARWHLPPELRMSARNEEERVPLLWGGVGSALGVSVALLVACGAGRCASRGGATHSRLSSLSGFSGRVGLRAPPQCKQA